VLVLVCHFTEHIDASTRAGRLIAELLGLTRHGVDLFFVLSGFLITGILYDAKNAPHYFRNFYGRRTLRIFPLYYAVLVFFFLILPCFKAYDTPELRFIWQAQWSLWLYCSNFLMAYYSSWVYMADWFQLSHFWSLAIEEQFYLIWPFLILLLSRRAAIVSCCFLIVGAVATRFLLKRSGVSDLSIFVLTPCRIDALAIGAFLALTARAPDGLSRLRHWTAPTFAASLAILIFTFSFVSRWDWLTPTLKYLGFGLGFGALLVLAISTHPYSLCGRFFSSTFLRFMGKYSYGIYVFHGLLIFWFYETFGPPVLIRLTHSYLAAYVLYFLLASTLSLAVAILSWHAFEKHFLKLKRYFT
jgi:peptidoglycan/LPS O-acetylase OafA/YrhL